MINEDDIEEFSKILKEAKDKEDLKRKKELIFLSASQLYGANTILSKKEAIKQSLELYDIVDKIN